MLGAHGVCVSRWPKLSSLERIGWVDLCLITMWCCSLRTCPWDAVTALQSRSLVAQRKPRERLQGCFRGPWC